MFDSSITYFGCSSGFLDITKLTYRWFGAVWRFEGSTRFILGYWFANSEKELMEQVTKTGWRDCTAPQKKNEIKEIYDVIRKEQKRQDWERRGRLPFFSSLRKPWSNLADGWYVITSRKEYPLISTALQKKRWSVWVEHVTVCEQNKDLDYFIQSVNRAHGVELTLRNEIQPGTALKKDSCF